MDKNNAKQIGLKRKEIYKYIKKEIISCGLSPGQLINEAELADKLSVSKTPIREALSQLQQDWLVELIPHKGYFVTTLTLRDTQEIFEMRYILERYAIIQAVDRVTDEDIRRLESYIEIDFTPGDCESIYRYIQANMDFHIEIAKISRNSRLVRHLASVLDDAQRLQFLDLESGEGPWAWQRDHSLMVEALRRHDKQAAIKAVEDSLNELRIRLLSGKVGYKEQDLYLERS